MDQSVFRNPWRSASVVSVNCSDSVPVFEMNHNELVNHIPTVRAAVSRILRDRPEDIEDVTQQTLYHALRSWNAFRGEAAVGSWLYRIGIHCAYQYLRELRRSRQNSPLSPTMTSPLPWPDTVAARRELLDKLMQGLSPEDRAMLEAVAENTPLDDIARARATTRTAIKVRLCRLRKRLHRRYEQLTR